MIDTDKMYDPQATIVIRGSYDFDKSGYRLKEVNAAQATEAFTASEYLTAQNKQYKDSIANLREYLIENIEDLGFDTANEIAEIFDIQLTKTLDVEFTIRYTATVNVPLDSDLDESDFHIQIDYNGNDDVDFESEDWEIDSFSADNNY